MTARHYDTALRPEVQRRLEEIRSADVVVGVPCLNNEDTIVRVLEAVSRGLHEHFRDLRAVIVVADGGSTDDTRDRASALELAPWQERVVTIYRGVGGKGSALRAVCETAHRLGARVCASVDSDLRSIDAGWVKQLLTPVLEGGFEYVAPLYARYKYDGMISSNIVYNLVRALYGQRIRQPAGGDVAFAGRLAGHFLGQPVWSTDIARFGVDVWMTLSAVVERARICQARLGAKEHDARDPADTVGPVFRQVCGTLLGLLEEHEGFWSSVQGSVNMPTFGAPHAAEPRSVEVNQPRMVHSFCEGVRLFGPLYRKLFSREVNEALEQAAALAPERFVLPVEVWVKLLYELAARYRQLEVHRAKLLTLMTPLYLGRVAAFITATRHMGSAAAEEVVEEQALVFEQHKPYLLEAWRRGDDPDRLRAVLAQTS